MRLLEHSILSDGYTQPIVTHPDPGDTFEVVDGFHRNRVGKESAEVRERVRGYLPVVSIREDRANTENRMAATVRHNRARGVHGVAPMTDLVAYLAKKGWDDAKIGKELGMDAEEVLRFRQISGLAELFKDEDFSQAWELEDDGESTFVVGRKA
jgi:ParB-like chromosome segregation protein Spo0J